MALEQVDVFQFMAIRAGEILEKSKSRKSFIRDDDYHFNSESLNHSFQPTASVQPYSYSKPTGINDVDLFSKSSQSEIGKLVYSKLTEKNSPSPSGNSKYSKSFRKSLENQIVDSVQILLTTGYSYSPNGANIQIPPLVKSVSLTTDLKPQDGLLLGLASGRKTYRNGNSLCILPDSLSDIVTPLTKELLAVLKLINEHLKATTDNNQAVSNLDLQVLISKIASKLGVENSDTVITDLVLDTAHGSYNSKFALTKRILFDSLYGLYILRKRESVSLEPVIDGLRACHLLEELAISEFFQNTIKNKSYPTNSANFISVLSSSYPLLESWDPNSQDAYKSLEELGLKIIDSWGEIKELLLTTPVVHPIFARLSYAFEAFNSIVPIGIGDLKVVKQTFLGYKKGEISHIETVLAGETKTRVNRSLEKTDDTFSTLSSSSSEITKDNQSTSRYELKNEADSTIKNDLNLNANASFTYKGNPVIDASVTAGMTYANSTSNSNKSSQNFVNEVISKATTRIQNNVSQQRTQTRQFETEETNTHSFTNTPPEGNISGIYQWLEKVYKGQIHNYGKRLMFEFILPEPAEYYVESRLYAYAAALDLPKYPEKITVAPSTTSVPPVSSAEEITEDLYNNVLSKKYSLADLPPPPSYIEGIPVVNGKQGGINFTKITAYNDTGLLKEEYNDSKLTGNLPTGYTFSRIRVSGDMWFRGKGEGNPDWQNTLQIFINDQTVFDKVDESIVHWVFDENSILQMPTLDSDTFNLVIGTKTCDRYTLQFYMTFQRGQATFSNWQNQVFERISTTQPLPSSTDNTASDQDFQSRLTEYQKKLDEIKATVLNDIIQGKSSEWNQDTINRELKRQCISMVAKEFDDNRSDDVISTIEATSKIELDVYYPVLDVEPGAEVKSGDTTKIIQASAKFDDKHDDPLPKFSFPNIEESKRKGKYIQFLEQAFEWDQLSCIFYPYFWASAPKWIELMNRGDDSDPLFNKFLQAGSCKALLAVKPGYENAVLHFLATKEPWEGGPSPVIGDPLYIPLYEEIRNQQDDLAGSIPVGEPWIFSLPTSLVYLESEKYPLVNEYKD